MTDTLTYYTKDEVASLKDAIEKIKNAIDKHSPEEFLKIYNSLISGRKVILPKRLWTDPVEMRVFRAVKHKICPDQISFCSFNPDATRSRCNIEGYHVFYGANRITPAIVESIIKTEDNYKNLYNSNFAGSTFILGEWTLEAKGTTEINFLYNHSGKNAATSPTVALANDEVNKSITNRPEEEQDLIKEIISIFTTLFYDDNDVLTSSFCNHLFTKTSIDYILYPTAIKSMDAVNFAMSAKTQERILKPRYINWCVLEKITDNDISNGWVSYTPLKVGLPMDDGSIKWLSDADSKRKYTIGDSTLKYYKKGNKLIISI